MLYDLTAAISLLIIVPAMVGWIRYKAIDQAYRPFIYLLSIGFINEVISLYCIMRYGTNAPNYNIFMLLEMQLILWQLKNWDRRKKNKLFYNSVAVAFLLLWLGEGVWRGSLSRFFSVFIITHSIGIALLSLFIIGKSFFYFPKRILKDTVFLVCFGFVIFYIFMAVLEVFWIFGYAHNPNLMWWVTVTLSGINFFTNFLYCFSVLCIPKSRQFIFPQG